MKTERKTVRGVSLEVTQVPALRGMETLAQLFKLDPAGDITRAVFAIQPQDVERHAIRFFEGARAEKDGKMHDLNTRERINFVFGSDVRALLEGMIFALSVQFESFSEAPSGEPASGQADPARLASG